MSVQREFIDYGYFALALPLPDLLVTWVLTAAFCIGMTESCQRWVSPWLKRRAGTLGRDDDESKVLELSVRISSVTYTGIVYFMSLYDWLYGEHYPTLAARVLGMGYIQPVVAASLMAYMFVDMHYLFQRKKYGMPAARFYTVLVHHVVTFLMQPVSFWAAFWQYYGNPLVVIAEATSLLSNLNVLLPDLGYPRDSDLFKMNTVVFAVTFIFCRVGGLSWLLYDMFHTFATQEEVWAFQEQNSALGYCTILLVLLYAVGLAWSFKLYQILMKTIRGDTGRRHKKKEGDGAKDAGKAE